MLVRTFFRGFYISQVFSAKDIARRTPNGLIRKTPGFGPRSALKLLQDEDREYGYVIERGNKFVGAVSIDSLKTALTQQQGLDAALIDAPLAVDAQTPLSAATIFTQRRSMAADCGYSSLSIQFLLIDKSINLWTFSSSQVWQKVARF